MRIVWDENNDPRGFGIVVLPSGRISYILQYRINGKQRRLTFKQGLTLKAARKEAIKKKADVARDIDPLAERKKEEGDPTRTLRAIAERYFKRDGAKLRSIDKRKRFFERLIFPVLGHRQIATIARLEIAKLLDAIEDENGPAQAELALAYLSKLFRWYAAKDSDFISPIVPGMIEVEKRERKRILSDDEIRAVWKAAEDFHVTGRKGQHPFGPYVRYLLLCATRPDKETARMEWTELRDGDDKYPGPHWIVPAERMKGRNGRVEDHVVPFSPTAKAIVDKIPRWGPFVFTTTGKRPIKGFDYWKTILQKRSSTSGWTLHDLRRTARSLMSRAGVLPDIGERVIAHKIAGVRGVYDRYEFYDEKRDALVRLARLIDTITNPPAGNVLPFHESRQKAG